MIPSDITDQIFIRASKGNQDFLKLFAPSDNTTDGAVPELNYPVQEQVP
jgi:hypothetical protein